MARGRAISTFLRGVGQFGVGQKVYLIMIVTMHNQTAKNSEAQRLTKCTNTYDLENLSKMKITYYLLHAKLCHKHTIWNSTSFAASVSAGVSLTAMYRQRPIFSLINAKSKIQLKLNRCRNGSRKMTIIVVHHTCAKLRCALT